MPEVIVVERSAARYNLLARTLTSARVDITRHYESFADAVDALQARIVTGQWPGLLVIGIPDRAPSECEKLLATIRDIPGPSLPLLLLSHAPMPALDRWLERRGRGQRILWSQFGQVPGLIAEIAPSTITQASLSEFRSGPIRMLLVDDSVSVRRTFHNLLSEQGYAVDLAESIGSGFAKAQGGRYDLILVDYFLPDGTGDELTRRLRAEPNVRGAQIAMITGSYKEDVIQRCLDAGAVECMFKNEVMNLTLARIRALARSVEDRRQNEAERQRLDGILKSVGDGVYEIDERGVLTFINPTGCSLLGHPDEHELIGKPAGQLALADKRSEAQTDPARRRLETVFLTRSGVPLPVECTVVPLGLGGHRQGAVVVFRDISERKSVDRVRYELEHDSLTGLANKRHFLARLAETIELRKQGGYSALIVLDVDRYTQVQENAGEIAAQQLLVEIGQRLKSRLRDNDVIARLEADQFGLKLENVQLENIYAIADSLRELITEVRYLSHANRSLGVTASVGVAIVSRDTPSAEYVLENARQACTQAKRRGQNQTQIFVVESETRIARELEAGWAVRIREAMAEDRLILLAHPIMAAAAVSEESLKDGEPGWRLNPHSQTEQVYELLMRLVNKDGQWVRPSVFVPLAERANLMPKIDLHVISRAIRMATRIPEEANVAFAINLSNQTLQDLEALTHIENTLSSHRVPGNRLIFEINETGEIHQIHAVRRFLQQLKKLGCRIALDDFGSGHNSLSHLKWLPVDMVKITGEFVAQRNGSEVDRAMALSLTQMAHSLKLKVIAERVDSLHAMKWLKAARVDFVQGHLFGEPRRLDEIDFYDLLVND